MPRASERTNEYQRPGRPPADVVGLVDGHPSRLSARGSVWVTERREPTGPCRRPSTSRCPGSELLKCGAHLSHSRFGRYVFCKTQSFTILTSCSVYLPNKKVAMNLSDPISDVIPSADAHVLAVLARTTSGLSGRRVAELTEGAVSHVQVSTILKRLVGAGIVHMDHQPPANVYSLNHDHVAAAAILGLASLRKLLIERMRAASAALVPPAKAVWLFGSMARGSGGPGSDIDVFVVRENSVPAGDEDWERSLFEFAMAVDRWSGNSCAIVEYSESELVDLIGREERLISDIAADGIRLAGDEIPRAAVLKRRRTSPV
jgi:DNA-binding transcriptional ArsR family regulator